MSESPLDGSAYLHLLLSSEIRVHLVTMFHKNPGIIDTTEAIARRIGCLPEAIISDLEEMTRLGVVRKRNVGLKEVFSLDRKKDAEVQSSIREYLRTTRLHP